MPIWSKDQSGFTLLELLMVVSILAIVSGGLYTMYDPMEAKALKSRTLSDLVTVDRSIRTFHSLSGTYPAPLDNLVQKIEPTTEVAHNHPSSDQTHQSIPIPSLPASITNQIGPFTLTASALNSLKASGLDRLDFLPTPQTTTDTVMEIRTLSQGDHVAAIQSGCQGIPLIEGFNFQSPYDSSMLSRQLGLDPTKCHLVVVFGLGKQASIISNPEGENPISLSNTPQYLSLASSSYNKYLLLFHLGTSYDANLQSSEIFPSAKFAGIFNPIVSDHKVASSSPLP